MKWIEKKFEICDEPEEGELVQFAVLHILQLKKLDIPREEVKFFMRDLQTENKEHPNEK